MLRTCKRCDELFGEGSFYSALHEDATEFCGPECKAPEDHHEVVPYETREEKYRKALERIARGPSPWWESHGWENEVAREALGLPNILATRYKGMGEEKS